MTLRTYLLRVIPRHYCSNCGRHWCSQVVPSLSASALTCAAGDDHHSCAVRHTWHGGQAVDELTIRTVSWMQGEAQPGYALLALEGGRWAVSHCDTPPQLYLLVGYAVYLLATGIYIVRTHYTRITTNKEHEHSRNNSTSLARTAAGAQPHSWRHWRAVAAEVAREVLLFLGCSCSLFVVIRWMCVLLAYL